MAIEVLLIKELNRLAAYDPISDESLRTIKQGEVVKVTIRRSRNPRHHAKFFALLKLVFDSQSKFPTMDKVLIWFKKAVNLGETMVIDGREIFIPDSISFAKMNQDDFEAFYNRAVEVLVVGLLPRVKSEELKSAVNDILQGRNKGSDI